MALASSGALADAVRAAGILGASTATIGTVLALVIAYVTSQPGAGARGYVVARTARIVSVIGPIDSPSPKTSSVTPWRMSP